MFIDLDSDPSPAGKEIGLTQQSLSSQGSVASYSPKKARKPTPTKPPLKKRKPLEEAEVETQQLPPSNFDTGYYDEDYDKENEKLVIEVEDNKEEDSEVEEVDDEATEY
jgi:hypothetical protein